MVKKNKSIPRDRPVRQRSALAAPSSPPNLPRYHPQALPNSQPAIVSIIDPETHRLLFQDETGLKRIGDFVCHACHEKIMSGTAPCAFCRMSEPLTADGQVHIIETIADGVMPRTKGAVLVQGVHAVEPNRPRS